MALALHSPDTAATRASGLCWTRIWVIGATLAVDAVLAAGIARLVA